MVSQKLLDEIRAVMERREVKDQRDADNRKAAAQIRDAMFAIKSCGALNYDHVTVFVRLCEAELIRLEQ